MALPARRPCGTRPDQLSALVDGALGDATRERLLTHLTGCDACRAEAESLRRVRDLLGSSRLAGGSAPDDLSRRLVGIAGEQASVPLWTRPFDQPRQPAALPMTHRVLRRRLGAAGVLASVLLIAFTTVGWTAAPDEVRRVDLADEGTDASFGVALTEVPLVPEGLAAVLLTTPGGRGELGGGAAPAVGEVVRRSELSHEESLVVLRNSAVAGSVLGRTGTQQVWFRDAGRSVRASVDVVVQPGQSAQVRVHDAADRQVGEGSMPLPEATISPELLGREHQLTGHLGAAEVAGRSATVVDARDRGRLVARWWVDEDSGLVLQAQRYDETGEVRESVGYTQLQIGASTFDARLAPGLAAFSSAGALPVADADRLTAQGWSCHETLGGLPLVHLRATPDGVLHATYSDGVHVLDVAEQSGELGAPASGYEWDEAARVWRSEQTVPTTLAWQSGERVLTVSTDAPADVVARAVAELPHEPPRERSAVSRVLEGWQRVTATVLQR
ncbi:sigma-E factor regulatory protein RseB domain-containing protein [Desertihabitans aurantiacus]|uniref:sigma-E factor regulatory protein RseB domain-containing protein n=1 Tax=Desertihabitans aurantiacus TaxID=2282477 RepID=UPI000DF84076|nr:sigma-E factor regulatory protein RseB domain-containing protein [Desertihabitans aurantiacus]